MGNPGVVHPDVKPPEFLHYAGHDANGLHRIAHVERQRQGRQAFIPELLRTGFGFLEVDVGQDSMCPGAGKGSGALKADALRSPGHDGEPSPELFVVVLCVGHFSNPQAFQPPSALISVPVMKLARSLARCTATLAISSGVAALPAGARAANAPGV